jgi:hypothetical protein
VKERKICPTCHQEIKPKSTGRICWDCKQTIRRHEHWHVGPDSRIRHNECPFEPAQPAAPVRAIGSEPGLLASVGRPLTITEAEWTVPIEGTVDQRSHGFLVKSSVSIGEPVTLAEIKKMATAAYASTPAETVTVNQVRGGLLQDPEAGHGL